MYVLLVVNCMMKDKGINLVYYFCRLKSGNRPKFTEALKYISSIIDLMTSHQWEESYDVVKQGSEVHKSFSSIRYII